MQPAGRVRRRRRTYEPWEITWTGPKEIIVRRRRRILPDCEQIRTFVTREAAEAFAVDHPGATLVHVDRADWRTPYELPAQATEG